ncbi:MAG: ABC transporter substrate-binding protein [Rhodoglobus sp.]
MRFITLTGVAIAATLVLAGCAGTPEAAPTAEPVTGGNLTIAWNAQPTTLDPIATTATTTRDIANNIFEGLFALDADAKSQPMLATGYEVNSDFTVYTVALREGVLFHNGDEMKSNDVVASLQRWIATSSIGKQDYSEVTVEADGDYAVTLTSPVPFYTMIELMTPPNQGLIIVPEESVAAVTDTGMPEEAIIGTGPYTLEKWTKDQSIVLERFDDYQGLDDTPSGLAGAKNAYLDTLTFEFVPDVTTRVNGLQTGEYDFASAVPADNLAQLESAGLTMSTEFIYQFLFVPNKATGFFSSEEARQALYYAIDPTAILTSAYGGADFFQLNGALSKPTQTNWYTEAGIDGRYDALDADKAKQMFEDAGYDGSPIKILTTRDYPDSYNGSVVLEQELKEAGLNAELVVVDQATLLTMRAETTGWDLFPTALGFGAPDTFLPAKSTWPGSTDSPKIADALAAIKASTSDEEAFTAREALQVEFYDYAAALKVGDAATLNGMSSALTGYTYLYGPIFFNISKTAQ